MYNSYNITHNINNTNGLDKNTDYLYKGMSVATYLCVFHQDLNCDRAWTYRRLAGSAFQTLGAMTANVDRRQ